MESKKMIVPSTNSEWIGRGHMKPFKMNCVRCGKEIIVKHKTAKYCKECATIRNRERAAEQGRRRTEESKKVCPVCGVRYKGKGKYCSPECKKEARSRPHPKTLEEIQKLAEKQNLTYGEYVALMERGKI